MLTAAILKYVSGGLALLCLALGIALAVEKHRSESLKNQRDVALHKLDEISTRKNEQKRATVRTVERVVKGDPIIIRQAERVEKAPLPGQCQTPAEIMGADL